MNQIDDIATSICQQLKDTNAYAIVDGFVGDKEMLGGILMEIERLKNDTASEKGDHAIGRFNAGELAGESGFWQTRYDPKSRGDFVVWLAEKELQHKHPAIQKYHSLCKQVVEKVFLSSKEYDLKLSQEIALPKMECDRLMVALYPLEQSSRFTRHVDNPNSNGRILTFTFYLNENWDGDRDGGQLAIYNPETFEEIKRVEPVLDRLVVFYADNRTPHAVLPTTPNSQGGKLHPYRKSITLWFSYLSPEQERAAFAGAFSNWIKNIQAKKKNLPPN